MDPLYTYIKGQGWVIGTEEHIITMRCGTRVRLEHRKPNPGEHWDHGNGISHFPDGKPDWALWVRIISGFSYDSLCSYDYRSEDNYFITVVPI